MDHWKKRKKLTQAPGVQMSAGEAPVLVNDGRGGMAYAQPQHVAYPVQGHPGMHPHYSSAPQQPGAPPGQGQYYQ